MKLDLEMLHEILELGPNYAKESELRELFDDLGLEVKDVLAERGRTVFNIETLSNRGDHLSAYGVAREVAARLGTAVKELETSSVVGLNASQVKVELETPLCLRYALAELVLPAKLDLSEAVRMATSGTVPSTKPAIVDILNYVQREIGQPMHAFDAEKVDGVIKVKENIQEEQFLALDGHTYSVPKGAVVICDNRQILAVAGVIGGFSSMVSAATRSVLLESACFDPVAVRKAARAMKLSTDASYMFERGTDIELVTRAIGRVAKLVGVEVRGLSDERKQVSLVRQIELRNERILGDIGAVAAAGAQATLEILGYVCTGRINERVAYLVPSWRLWDVESEDDLIEDLARIYGYNSIAKNSPSGVARLPEVTGLQALREHLGHSLLERGFSEVITRSYYSSQEVELLALLDKQVSDKHLQIRNAVDSAYSHLKVNNIVHMTSLATQNMRRGISSVKVFEFGKIFSSDKHTLAGAIAGIYEHDQDVLSVACSGRWQESDWKKGEEVVELTNLGRGIITDLLRTVGVDKFQVSNSGCVFLHPGMQGRWEVNAKTVGFGGIVHPLIQEQLECKFPVFYAQFLLADLVELKQHHRGQIREVFDYPVVRRDLTLKIARRDFAGQVICHFEQMQVQNLRSVSMVDDFIKGDEEFRRVTYRLYFQDSTKTLAGSEVDSAIASVLLGLGKLGIELAG